MRLHYLVLSACVMLGCAVLPGPAAAQQGTAPDPSLEVLAGVGVGWRDSPWHIPDKPHLRALTGLVAIRRPAHRLLNVEAELGWWQEETVRVGTPPGDGDVTAHLLTLGVNVFLLPRLGSFRPRAGVGVHVGHHFDTGTHRLSETALGAQASIGGELDLSPRLGAYALVQTEGVGTWVLYRLHAGVRMGVGH